MSELGTSFYGGSVVAAVMLVGIAFVQCGTTDFGSANDSGVDAMKGHGTTSAASSGASTGASSGSTASGSSRSSGGMPDAGPRPDAMSGDAGGKGDAGRPSELCEDKLTCGGELCCKRIHITNGTPYPDAGECQPLCFDSVDAGLHERHTCVDAKDCAVGSQPICCAYPDAGVSVCETRSLCSGRERCGDGGLCTPGQTCCPINSPVGQPPIYMCSLLVDDAGMCVTAVGGAAADAGN